MNELTGQKIQSEEILLDNELLKQLTQFELLDQSIQLQDHFIKVRHAVRKNFIEVAGWQKKGYEIIYSFKRENKTTILKTWINKESIFNENYLKQPSFSNNEELGKEIETLLKTLPNVSIKRNTAETIINKINFDFALEEQFPVTRKLFDDLASLFEGTEIIIDDLDHQQYHERYSFKRREEFVQLNFWYNEGGFFGKVIPAKNKINSHALLTDIQMALQTFKLEVYAG